MIRSCIIRPYFRLAIVAVALAAVVAAGMCSASSAVGAPSDEQQIEQLLRDAMFAQQQVDVPPGVYQAGEHMPASVVQQMEDRIQQRLSQLYTGQRLAQLSTIMKTHASEQQFDGADREVAGGVDRLTLRQLHVSADTASAQIQVVKWLRFSHLAPDNHRVLVETPHQAMDFSFTLAKTADGWRISDEAMDFAPGNGP